MNGIVSAADRSWNRVTIDVGTDDELRVGDALRVLREDRPMGMIVLIEVGPDRAVGHFTPGEGSDGYPSPGDAVDTGP